MEVWPELLLRFGPYAVLALFLLLVVPRSSKYLANLDANTPKSVRMTATGAVVLSWGVVLLMVGYILLTWSPLRVHDGRLGVLEESESVIPMSERLYVRAEGVMQTPRDRWNFVLVAREDELEAAGTADFAYLWGDGDDEFTIYRIPIEALARREVQDFGLTHKDPGAVYRWEGQEWRLASASGTESPGPRFNPGWAAYADDGRTLEEIRRMLVSPNRLVRIEARLGLRDLSDAELETLRGMTEDPKALRAIERERERRR